MSYMKKEKLIERKGPSVSINAILGLVVDTDSSRLRRIILALEGKKNGLSQKTLSKMTQIAVPHVCTSLQHGIELNLIYCLNEEVPRRRLYALTSTGKTIPKKIQKIEEVEHV